MGIPWHGHKLLWDGNGTDKYVPWTTLVIRLAVGLGFFQLRMYSVIPSLKFDSNTRLFRKLWPTTKSYRVGHALFYCSVVITS